MLLDAASSNQRHTIPVQQSAAAARPILIGHTRGEETLKRSEALLAGAQRLSSTGSFYWRAVAAEFKWSEGLHRIFSLDATAPVTPEPIRRRVHPEDVP